MPEFTTDWEIPYPLGTEAVSSLDDTGLTLAERLDELATIHGRHAVGTSTKAVSAGGVTETLVVAFPAGRFTAAPDVVTVTVIVGVATAASHVRSVWSNPGDRSATQMTLNFRTEAAVSITVEWHAVQGSA